MITASSLHRKKSNVKQDGLYAHVYDTCDMNITSWSLELVTHYASFCTVSSLLLQAMTLLSLRTEGMSTVLQAKSNSQYSQVSVWGVAKFNASLNTFCICSVVVCNNLVVGVLDCRHAAT